MTAKRKPVFRPTGKIAFQGMPGAYSHLACQAVFPDREPLPCASFHDAFVALEEGRADLAMIPIDNSIAGRTTDIHHLLPRYPFHIVAEHFQPVDHCLLGVEGARLSDVRRVLSHTHALPQCRKLIRQMKLEPVVWSDTAGAAARVAQMRDKSSAAIASPEAAKLYGLKVLKTGVSDEKNNVTRFLALSRKDEGPRYVAGKDYVTSMMFSVRNMPAALYKALGGFATNGINMLKLESYMPGGGFRSTFFYAEVEGHLKSPALAQALDELKFFGTDIRLLGSYAAHPRRKAQTKA